MNDETRAHIEETNKVERDIINRLIEAGETEILLEKIRFYAETTEVMARALVNKISKE